MKLLYILLIFNYSLGCFGGELPKTNLDVQTIYEDRPGPEQTQPAEDNLMAGDLKNTDKLTGNSPAITAQNKLSENEEYSNRSRFSRWSDITFIIGFFRNALFLHLTIVCSEIAFQRIVPSYNYLSYDWKIYIISFLVALVMLLMNFSELLSPMFLPKPFFERCLHTTLLILMPIFRARMVLLFIEIKVLISEIYNREFTVTPL